MANAYKVAPLGRTTRDVHIVLWCLVFLMHLATCGFAFTMAYAHQYLQHVTGGYNYVRVLKLLQPVTVTVAVYASIGTLHVLLLVRMCIWLVRPPIPTTKHSSCGGPIVRAMRRTLRLFSSRGPYYEVKLAIKHVVLAASQTYRAYATSVLVDVSMINLTFSVLLFAYGVLLPLLWRFASPVARRQYTIAAAVGINFTANVILPMWILRPYYDYFTRPDGSKIVYQDTFYPIGISVCQSVLATSHLDLGVAAITHAFLLFALADFMTTFVLAPKELLQRASAQRDRKLPRWCSFSAIFGYITSIFWAITVLAISFASLRQPLCEPGCLAQTYPWLTGKCACTVLETTCDGANDTLSLPPTDSLEARSLVFLIISHCPRLVMPPSLQAFTNLIGLEIFNSTLLEWDEAASIAPLTRFSYAQMVHTNMTDLPLGLFVNAPSTFIDLEISGTNLHQISLDPDLLTTLTVLYIEYGLLDAFPYQITNLPLLNELSLFSNNIPSVPENLSLPSLNYLQLSSNPLNSVPDAAFGLPYLWEMYVDHSNVSAFPTSASVYGSALYVIGAHNSSYCVLSENATCNETPDCALVSCEPNEYMDGYFPTTVILQSRNATNLLQRLATP